MPQQDDHQGDGQQGDRQPDTDARTGQAAAAARIHRQAQWVDLQIQQAMERGEFDNLPGAGKPIEGLGAEHDPDWWLKKLVERERIVVLPAALQLRKDDAELDAMLDDLPGAEAVRRELEAFNQRVVQARRQLEGGPPVITQLRDVDHELDAWAERRRARLARPAVRRDPDDAPPRTRRWFRRRT